MGNQEAQRNPGQDNRRQGDQAAAQVLPAEQGGEAHPGLTPGSVEFAHLGLHRRHGGLHLLQAEGIQGFLQLGIILTEFLPYHAGRPFEIEIFQQGPFRRSQIGTDFLQISLFLPAAGFDLFFILLQLLHRFVGQFQLPVELAALIFHRGAFVQGDMPGQAVEDPCRQTGPEVGIDIMPGIELNLGDIRPVGRLGFKSRSAALRLYCGRFSAQHPNMLAHLFHEEALAHSPVAEQADRQRGRHIPGGDYRAERLDLVFETEAIVALQIVGGKPGDGAVEGCGSTVCGGAFLGGCAAAEDLLRPLRRQPFREVGDLPVSLQPQCLSKSGQAEKGGGRSVRGLKHHSPPARVIFGPLVERRFHRFNTATHAQSQPDLCWHESSGGKVEVSGSVLHDIFKNIRFIRRFRRRLQLLLLRTGPPEVQY